MFRLLSLFLLVPLVLTASESFQSSKICKGCHPLIYAEYQESMHRKSSIFNDPVHRAVWEKHPLLKKKRYSCAKCHTPSDTKLMKALKSNRPALPEPNEIQKEEPIGCTYCHRIEQIERGEKSNSNTISQKERTYFAAKEGKRENRVVRYHKTSDMMGLSKKSEGSPFHVIDYSNLNFSNGKMCLGCHEYKKNGKGFIVCTMDLERSKKGKTNCITCHMPQVAGAISTLSEGGSHAYHGFSGLHNRPELLAKYIEIDVSSSDEGISVTLKNKADHTLFAHPVRVGELHTEVVRGNRRIELPTVYFYTKLGKDGKPAMPWDADSVLSQNRIEAHETFKKSFSFKTAPGDKITATLGYRIVNPKAAQKLGIEPGELTALKVLAKRTVRF